jgi:hypothetical protein
LAATGPPPAPDPITMYSTAASGPRAVAVGRVFALHADKASAEAAKARRDRDPGISGSVQQRTKHFFFEKKKQKTFIHEFLPHHDQKVFGSFFKKNTCLPF